MGSETDYLEKIKEYKEQVEAGNSSAMLRLGYMYYQGQGVTQDYRKARELYERAAGNGNLRAVYRLGYMYFHGQSVKQDYRKARELYESAAGRGDVNSLNELGYMYSYGLGVTADYSTAIRYYERAIRGNVQAAKNNLASLYKQNEIKINKLSPADIEKYNKHIHSQEFKTYLTSSQIKKIDIIQSYWDAGAFPQVPYNPLGDTVFTMAAIDKWQSKSMVKLIDKASQTGKMEAADFTKAYQDYLMHSATIDKTVIFSFWDKGVDPHTVYNKDNATAFTRITTEKSGKDIIALNRKLAEFNAKHKKITEEKERRDAEQQKLKDSPYKDILIQVFTFCDDQKNHSDNEDIRVLIDLFRTDALNIIDTTLHPQVKKERLTASVEQHFGNNGGFVELFIAFIGEMIDNLAVFAGLVSQADHNNRFFNQKQVVKNELKEFVQRQVSYAINENKEHNENLGITEAQLRLVG